MSRILTAITLFIVITLALPAGARAETTMPEARPEDALKKFTRGWYMAEVDGDSVPMIVLSTITVYPPMVFKNKKDEEFYWKTVRDVRKTLPYAKLICETLTETYEYIETLPTKKEREDHLKRM